MHGLFRCSDLHKAFFFESHSNKTIQKVVVDKEDNITLHLFQVIDAFNNLLPINTPASESLNHARPNPRSAFPLQGLPQHSESLMMLKIKP